MSVFFQMLLTLITAMSQRLQHQQTNYKYAEEKINILFCLFAQGVSNKRNVRHSSSIYSLSRSLNPPYLLFHILTLETIYSDQGGFNLEVMAC
jgi:hypothetical protein